MPPLEKFIRGKVLPIGGLNEKLLAARRSGIKIVLIPKENEKDLSEIKSEVKDGMNIIPIQTIKEALPYVFEIKQKSNSKKNNQLPKDKKQKNFKIQSRNSKL